MSVKDWLPILRRRLPRAQPQLAPEHLRREHITGELVGRFLTERRALKAVALTTDTSVITSIANDYGFDHIFVRQIEGLGSPGDVAIGISTSGNSASIHLALAKAREMGLKTIALTGQGGGACAACADVLLAAPSSEISSSAGTTSPISSSAASG